MLDPEGHKAKTARNREWSAGFLWREKIEFSSHNKGAHLIVRHAGEIVDFWPGTGKWISRDGATGRGVMQLVKKLKGAKGVKKDQPRIICLCGSSKYIENIAVMAWLLEKEGAIVLGLHLLPAWYTAAPDHQAEHEGVKEHFDELHKRKIELSDSVFIMNVDGYIGESTKGEIQYAEFLGKPITYLEKGSGNG